MTTPAMTIATITSISVNPSRRVTVSPPLGTRRSRDPRPAVTAPGVADALPHRPTPGAVTAGRGSRDRRVPSGGETVTRREGFTLIEVMVAMVIAGVVIVAAHRIFTGVADGARAVAT